MLQQRADERTTMRAGGKKGGVQLVKVPVCGLMYMGYRPRVLLGSLSRWSITRSTYVHAVSARATFV
jgi:hypothetical protein